MSINKPTLNGTLAQFNTQVVTKAIAQQKIKKQRNHKTNDSLNDSFSQLQENNVMNDSIHMRKVSIGVDN